MQERRQAALRCIQSTKSKKLYHPSIGKSLCVSQGQPEGEGLHCIRTDILVLRESCTSTDIAWPGPRMVGQSAHALKKR